MAVGLRFSGDEQLDLLPRRSLAGARFPSHLAAMASSDTRDFSFDLKPPRTRAERIARIEALAALLDTAFIIPGTNLRFGADALVGLIPGVGDALTTVISLWLVKEARALGAPGHLIARMLGNIAIDGVVGAVPLVGDAFDLVWKSNRRNLHLLRRHLERESPAVNPCFFLQEPCFRPDVLLGRAVAMRSAGSARNSSCKIRY